VDVIVIVCLFVSNFVKKIVRTDLHEIFKEGCQWASEQMFKFWWRSGSRIHIATLVRRALAEACTVPMLLVQNYCCLTMQQHIFSCPAPPGPANGTYFSLFNHLKWTYRARLQSDRKGRRNGERQGGK